MNWVGIDIGGANLKAADGAGWAAHRSFALWKEPDRLAARLVELLEPAAERGRVAVTMTGELADCFASKAAGVRRILEAVRRAVRGARVRVYRNDGELVSVEQALAAPLAVAAANWHALAAFAARYAAGPALLLDVGSTTTDIIPLVNGCPAGEGRDDVGRLLHGELVYTGVERSPVCAVAPRVVPYRGRRCPPAQELFATMRDVYLTLGQLAEEPACHETADGRPATRAAAVRRLARVLCADPSQFTARDAARLAESVAAAQARLIARAVGQVGARMPSPPETWLAAGHGDFLVRAVQERAGYGGPTRYLSHVLGPRLSRVATAHALAVLARERSG